MVIAVVDVVAVADGTVAHDLDIKPDLIFHTLDGKAI
jgi:hypothetical protein